MDMANLYGMMELSKKEDGKKAILKDQAENSKFLLVIRIIIIFVSLGLLGLLELPGLPGLL